MEPVCLFHDDQDHVHLGSGLKLRSFVSEGLQYTPERKQHCVKGDGDDANLRVEFMKNDADCNFMLVAEETKDDRRKDGKNSSMSEAPVGVTPILSSAEDDTLLGHDRIREDFGDMDPTNMCFEGYEKDGMLIESVPASSPASFFHSDAMRVSKENCLIRNTDIWRDVPSSQEEAECHTSATKFVLTEKRGSDSMFRKETTQDRLANDEISRQREGIENTQFNELSDPGLADAEEISQSPKRSMEAENHPEQNNTTHGSLLSRRVGRIDLRLRSILSDPITGAFLDDAMVAQCGHSFGSGSLQKVMETRICVICGTTTSPDSLFPNFALRAAVLAYRHEEQLQMNSMRRLKRGREVSEQVEGSHAKRLERDILGSVENIPPDDFRSQALQFPFAVSDKVLIKGNKRTPERFVGREAIITAQCLNGWYLVKTLDTGESVRLQYRSLKKLGDVVMPSTSEMEYFPEQGGDCSGSPTELSQGPTKAAVAIRGLESASPGVQRDTARGKLGQHGPEENTIAPCFLERDLIRHPGSSRPVRDTPKNTVEDLLRNQERNVGDRIMEEGPNIAENCRDEHANNGGCDATVGQAVPDAVVEKFRTDLLHGAAQDAIDSGSPRGNRDQETDSDSLRTRSRRTTIPCLSSLPVGACGRDPDPCRKSVQVFTSGCRRRGGKREKLVRVSPDNGVAESKLNVTWRGSVSRSCGPIHGGGLESGKDGRDMNVKSAINILRIMRKDMLKLEKQIPRDYLLNSWRSDRMIWRKAVKASCTVLELGNLVSELRHAMLLTAAGGMTDEELQKCLTMINESGDVDLLVSLYGRLYDDIDKCVESRPKRTSILADSFWRGLLTVEANHGIGRDFNPSGQSVPSGQITTTTTTTTTTTAVEDGRLNSDSDVKTLLSSAMNLLQTRSRMELVSLREALEREKQHILARLAKLEERYVQLGGTAPEYKLTDPVLVGEASDREPSHLLSTTDNKRLFSGNHLVMSTSNDEKDEDRAQVPDSEATDMSD